MIRNFILIFTVTVASVVAQPYQGTIFNFPDSFKDSDRTAFTETTYKGQESRRVYDRRYGYITINAYIYIANFNDGCKAWEMIVNPEFNQNKAKELAEKYAHNIGQIPICIRTGITGAVIHDGKNPWGGGNPLTIHHGQGISYENQGIVTETMIHEATHAAFDPKYYTNEWYDAAKADGKYISTYAKDNPNREDHAESFLCWLTARYKKDRISSNDFTKITTTIPNRLKFYDNKNFNLSPMGTTDINHKNSFVQHVPLNTLKNYPNPFASSITIIYSIENPSQVVLQILDMKGIVIRTLVNEKTAAQNYKKSWDIYDDRGKKVSGGTYIIRLVTNEYQKTQTMMLLR